MDGDGNPLQALFLKCFDGIKMKSCRLHSASEMKTLNSCCGVRFNGSEYLIFHHGYYFCLKS